MKLDRSSVVSITVCIVGVFMSIVAFTRPTVTDSIYQVSIVFLIVGTTTAGIRGMLNRRLIITLGGVVVSFGASAVAASLGVDRLLVESLDFVGALFLAATMLELVNRNYGSDEGVLGDALVVGFGSWLTSWVLLVEPMLRRLNSTGSSILSGLYLPVGSVILFLVMWALFRNTRRYPSMQLICTALIFNLAGDVSNAMYLAGHIDSVGVRLSNSAYIIGYTFSAAAFLHPSVGNLTSTQRNNDTQTRFVGRLVITAMSLLTPFLLLAIVPPTNRVDKLVRAVSALILGGATALRVVLAVRSNHRTQQILVRNAQTDALTGLPNRTLILDQINDCIQTSWKTHVLPTVYFVDLDRFKNINDSLGHAAGDELLTLVANRLVNAVPGQSTVGRLSGDEYVVIDPAPESPGRAMEMADRLLAVFAEPFGLSHGDVFVSASVGVASCVSGTKTTAEDLLRHADTAMYRAKDAGRNCMAVFDESMHERVAQRLAIETALYRALDRRELRLFHQPILDLESGDVVGFEALMRWQQGDGTIVSPAEFIPIAEDTGTIVPIGAWAVLEALSQLKSWIGDGVCSPTATMSVNVSPRQLADPNFPNVVSEALVRSGVSPHQLWLEVTESMMISEPEIALASLRKLRMLGVRIALDDFGTGFSSLSLIQKFPLQRLKIDRAFVQGVADNSNDRSLVRTIVAMGRSLGLDLVAEGVESIHQLQVLHDLGCTKAQGFLISHPVPGDAMRSTVAALERLGGFPNLRTGNSPINR